MLASLCCVCFYVVFVFLFPPHLQHFTLVWVHVYTSMMHKLIFLLQKKANRTIIKSHYLAHTDHLFKKIQLLKFKDIPVNTQISAGCFYVRIHKPCASTYYVFSSFLLDTVTFIATSLGNTQVVLSFGSE